MSGLAGKGYHVTHYFRGRVAAEIRDLEVRVAQAFEDAWALEDVYTFQGATGRADCEEHLLNDPVILECDKDLRKQICSPDATALDDACIPTPECGCKLLKPSSAVPVVLGYTSSLLQGQRTDAVGIARPGWESEISVTSEGCALPMPQPMSYTLMEEVSKEVPKRKALQEESLCERCCDDPVQSASARWLDMAVGLLDRQEMRLRKCWEANNVDVRSNKVKQMSPLLVPVSVPLPRGSLGSEESSEEEPITIVQQCWIATKTHRRSSITRTRISVSDEKRWDMEAIRKRLVIHPFGWKCLLWILLSLFILGLDMITMTMPEFGLTGESPFFTFCELTINVYWTCDVGVSFATGFVEKNCEMNMKFVAIARNYLRSWFVFDLCLVVLQWTTFMMDTGHEVGLVRYLRVMRYLRLLRIAKIERLLNKILDIINSATMVIVLRVSVYLASIVLWVHFSACAWYSLGMRSQEGWAQRRPEMDSWSENYVMSTHWAMAQLQGGSDIYPTGRVSERAFATCHIFISVIVLATFVSKLTTAMHTIEFIKEKKNAEVLAVQNYCRMHHISPGLALRARRYVEWRQCLDSDQGQQEVVLMAILPMNIRRALLEEARSPCLKNHVVFRTCWEYHARFFERLCCDALVTESHLPDTDIFAYNMTCNRMYFVEAGESIYTKYNSVLALIMQTRIMATSSTLLIRDSLQKRRSSTPTAGKSLCEAALWVQWVHMGDYGSVTQLSLLALEVPAFEDLLRLYVVVQLGLQAHAVRFLEALREGGADDTFHSEMFL